MGSGRSVHRVLTLAAFLGFACLATACSDDSNDPVGPGGDAPYDSITVDAHDGWAAIRLGEPASQVTITGDIDASDDWDIAFNGTAVMLNGGDAGPGDVSGYCICANASATDDQVTQMTDASELADFTSVTDAEIPSSSDAWQSDAVALAIQGWYNYNPTTHAVSAAPEKLFIIRSASGLVFAKLHVTDITEGVVTFEYAITNDQTQPFGGTETGSVTLSDDDSPVYFDFETGTSSTTEDPSSWDIAFVGYSIEVNGGTSGSGEAGAASIDEEFDSLTDVDGVPSAAFDADGFGGVFVESPYYRYNLLDNHHIWPVFNVYLIKVGDAVYKIQITNYYDVNGNARHITTRYAKLAG